ncbi:MAG: 5'/3'-nucleotidase SurE [Zhaonellaceae bacterium]|jgi:5'-nucleotidase
MHILLTNDDGLLADGIQYLRQYLAELGQTSMVAPERERSGMGHGITMHKPLRANKVFFEDKSYGWSVSGTPADCVKLALDKLLPTRPDIVISGINNGLNMGTDILYSGTVSAALEAIIEKIPAIAVSVEEEATKEDFIYAAQFIKNFLTHIPRKEFTNQVVLNINIPRISLGPISGVEITIQGLKRYGNTIVTRLDPRGKEYYWLSGELLEIDSKKNTDLAALARRAISITPLHFDLTNHDFLNKLFPLTNLFPN